MFCYNCGKQIDDKAVFCVYCGVQVGKLVSCNEVNGQGHNKQNKCSGFSIAGFVLSFFGWLSILGLIFSCIGYNKSASRKSSAGIGLGLAGIIISCLDIVLFTLSMAIVFSSC